MSKKKAIGILVGLGALLGLVTVASASKRKDYAAPAKNDDEVLPTEELDDQEVVVSTPGPNGEPEGGPSIVVPTTDDTDDEETVIDQKLIAETDKTGQKPEDAVAEVVQTVTQGQGVSPIGKEETSVKNDPKGTVALARKLLAREVMPNWKNDLKPDVQVWQRAVGLDPDGEFGLYSAQRMAQEVGLLPLIRTWNKSITTKKQAEQTYDQMIGQVVQSLQSNPDSKAHIEALVRSMQREQAQAFGSKNPPAQPTLEFAQFVTDEIATRAEAEGAKS